MKKTYALSYNTKKLGLVKTIIKTEDLDATAKIGFDAYGNTLIEVICDEEDYAVLKEVFNMVG